MAEPDLDRNEAATPYKLEKARERGQVARSADVTAAGVLAAAMVFLAWQGWPAWRTVFRFDRAILVQAGHLDASPAVLWSLIERVLSASLVLGAPFFVTLLLAAVAGNVLQSGPVFSLHPLKADWTRVIPVSGFKRLVSMRTLFHGLRALLKLVLLGTVVYFALKRLVPHFYALSGLSPAATLRTLLDDVASLGFQITLMLALIALLDLGHTKREFARQMRMSRRELRDELKHREGDPRIRARLRELRRELLKRSLALRRTRDADVVVTNPTHLAVALRYVHGRMESPRIVAKGAGLLAAAMRRIAARHSIPVVPNPTLARALYHGSPIDSGIPQELYAPVARILVWVFAMRDARNRRAASTRETGRPPLATTPWSAA